MHRHLLFNALFALALQLFCKSDARLSCECLRQCRAFYCVGNSDPLLIFDCSYIMPANGVVLHSSVTYAAALWAAATFWVCCC